MCFLQVNKFNKLHFKKKGKESIAQNQTGNMVTQKL